MLDKTIYNKTTGNDMIMVRTSVHNTGVLVIEQYTIINNNRNILHDGTVIITVDDLKEIISSVKDK